MRVLIIGGDGFIGGRLARSLDAAGAAVVRTSRRPGADAVFCDLADAASVRAALAQARPDAVFQLAGTCANSDARSHYLVHAVGAANLVEAAAELAPRAALLFAGSAAEYGEADPADLPLREDHPCAPGGFYGAAKLAQTHAAGVAAAMGLRAVVFRPFNVIGPGLPGHYFLGALARTLADLAGRSGRGRVPVYNAAATRDYLDVRDAARALALLAQAAVDGAPGLAIYNLCSGRETPILEPARRLAAGFGDFAPYDAGPGPGRSGILRSVGDPGKLCRATGWAPEFGWERSVDDMLRGLRP